MTKPRKSRPLRQAFERLDVACAASWQLEAIFKRLLAIAREDVGDNAELLALALRGKVLTSAVMSAAGDSGDSPDALRVLLENNDRDEA